MARSTAGEEAGRALLTEVGSQQLEPRLTEIVGALIARLQDLPELDKVAGDRELWATIERSAYLNVRNGLAHLSYPLPLPTALDPEALRLAQLWARRGLSSGTLVRTYRLAHEVVWHYWFEAIARASVSTEDRRELLERVSRFLFTYMDRVSGLIDEEYARQRSLMFRNRRETRLELIKDILHGHPVDPRGLGYDLDRWHLGIVGSGAGVGEAIRALGERHSAATLIIGTDGYTWGWIGSERPFPQIPDGRTRRLAIPEGARIALGDPAHGPDGFRSSHEQAAEVERMAHGNCGLIAYDDVALEVLALRDVRTARRFVARELGDLAETSRRAATLRATLRAYFRAGQNASAAAAALGVHEQTIGYRLRTIEESRGRPITSRRAELETALRIRELLDPQAQPEPRPQESSGARQTRTVGEPALAVS